MRAFILIALSFRVLAGELSPAKPIWQWSVEDRLAVRFDPARAAQRAADSDVSSGEHLWGRVSGATHPELFLPSELFISLMDGLDSNAVFAATSRSVLRDRITAFGFEEEQFWRDLERATGPYVELAHRRAALLRQLDPESPSQQSDIVAEARRMDANLCATRAAALASARRQFGADLFDRFLYTVVAPGLTISATAPSADTPRQLKFIEGGCE